MVRGTWGRRVYGHIKKGAVETEFQIRVNLREGYVIGSTILVENVDLIEAPGTYKDILDMMVIDIERAINAMN